MPKTKAKDTTPQVDAQPPAPPEVDGPGELATAAGLKVKGTISRLVEAADGRPARIFLRPSDPKAFRAVDGRHHAGAGELATTAATLKGLKVGQAAELAFED